jgi:hypothetical protein
MLIPHNSLAEKDVHGNHERCTDLRVGSPRSESRQQFTRGLSDELRLGVPADLYQREGREPGRLEVANPGDVSLQVRTAGHLRRHVFLAHGFGRGVERSRDRALGVDSPVAGEPTELLHRPLHGDLRIGSYDNAICPTRGFPAPPAASNRWPSAGRRSIAIMTSACRSAAAALGITTPDGVHASVFLLDRDGIVRWRSVARRAGDERHARRVVHALTRSGLAVPGPSSVLTPLVAIAAAALVVGLGALAAIANDRLVSWDRPVQDAIQDIGWPGFENLMRFATDFLGNRVVLAPITILLAPRRGTAASNW